MTDDELKAIEARLEGGYVTDDPKLADNDLCALIAEVRKLRKPPSTVFEVPYGEMNDVLFDLCREDDYRGIYMEIIRRLDEGVKP